VIKVISRLKYECSKVGCLIVLGAMKIVIAMVPFKRIMQVVTNSPKESTGIIDRKSAVRAWKIMTILEWVANRTPWQSKCYDQALAGSILLRMLGVSSTIYFGIRKSDEGIPEAHAWLRAGPLYITGNMCRELFTPLYFGSYQSKQRIS